MALLSRSIRNLPETGLESPVGSERACFLNGS
jgi:hypothetical protein